MTTTVAPQTKTLTNWTIDPSHTLIEFSAKHMMVTTVKGRFTEVTGTIIADEETHTDTAIDVEINAASLTTGADQRDAHLKSPDFLDVENYPTITFKSTRIEKLNDDKFRVTGNLTIHGVTREIAFEAEDNGRGTTPWGAEVAGFTAHTEINRKDFGLGWNVALETGGVLVSDKIKISLEVEAVKQAE